MRKKTVSSFLFSLFRSHKNTLWLFITVSLSAWAFAEPSPLTVATPLSDDLVQAFFEKGTHHQYDIVAPPTHDHALAGADLRYRRHLQYDDVYFIAPEAQGRGDGTYGNAAPLTQTTLNTIHAQMPTHARIYIQGGNHVEYKVNASTTENEGLYVYDGQDFFGTTQDYTAPAILKQQPIITVDAAHQYNGFVIHQGENTFADVTITEYSSSITDLPTNYSVSGIIAYSETGSDLSVNIFNSHIIGMDTYGIKATTNGSETLTINTVHSQFDHNGGTNNTYDTNSEGAGIYAQNNPSDATQQGKIIIKAHHTQFNDNGVAQGDNSVMTSYASGIYTRNNSAGNLAITATDCEFNGNGVASGANSMTNSYASGLYARNAGEGTLTIDAVNTQFNGNGVASGDQSTTSDYPAGIYARNNGGGALVITANHIELNGNGLGAGDDGKHSGRDGMNIENNTNTGSVTLNAQNSQFSNNRNAGLYASNLSTLTGTLLVSSLSGSHFENNTDYGIYGFATQPGYTTIDYTAALFANNGLDTSGSNITWIH